MKSIPNRFQFGPETPAQRLPELAHLKWLKDGDAVVFCGHRYMHGDLCGRELGKLFKPPQFGTRSVPLDSGGVIYGFEYWVLIGPRATDGYALFDRLAGGIFRPQTGGPRLTRRPLPPELAARQLVRRQGRDRYHVETKDRTAVGYVVDVSRVAALVHCPVCGTDNEVPCPEG
jgi:hypothetical protein